MIKAFVYITILCYAVCRTGPRILCLSDQAFCDTIKTAVCKEFSIRLSCKAGQGYSWSLRDSAFTDKLAIIGMSFKTEKSIPGADGMQTFTFRANKKGEAAIRFRYHQPFLKTNENSVRTKCYQITIN